MEKDIDKIQKNADTDIVVRVDDFGGRVGLTIREFVRSERYTGFTKAGTRIPADKFVQFKKAINSIDEKELADAASAAAAAAAVSAPTAGEEVKPVNGAMKSFEKKEFEGKEMKQAEDDFDYSGAEM